MQGPLRTWFLFLTVLTVAAGVWLIVIGLWEGGPLEGAANLPVIAATGAVIAVVSVFVLGLWIGWAMIRPGGESRPASDQSGAASPASPAPAVASESPDGDRS